MDKQNALSDYIAKECTSRKVEFYHAENLQNFKTHCKNGNLICRDLLFTQGGSGYTKFYSDKKDRQQGVHVRVFGNLTDFGWIFATYRGQVIPNIYGPIALCFDSAVFQIMNDIVITKQTITKLDKNWRNSLVTVSTKAEVDDICSGCPAPTCPIKESWHFCEISCGNQTISLDYLKHVTVEPIIIDGKRLIDSVREVLAEAGLDKPVYERQYSSIPNGRILDDLVNYCFRCATERDTRWDIRKLPESVSVMPEFKKNRLMQWCRYFIFGTIHELLRDQAWEPDQSTCEVCDPGSDDPPALIDWSRLTRDGHNTPLDYGFCTWCHTLSLRCAACGIVYPMPEGNYNEENSCVCGLRFAVDWDPKKGESSFESIRINS